MIVSLCGRAKCCATVETTKDGYVIRDDFGGQVKLTNEEMRKLLESEW